MSTLQWKISKIYKRVCFYDHAFSFYMCVCSGFSRKERWERPGWSCWRWGEDYTITEKNKTKQKTQKKNHKSDCWGMCLSPLPSRDRLVCLDSGGWRVTQAWRGLPDSLGYQGYQENQDERWPIISEKERVFKNVRTALLMFGYFWPPLLEILKDYLLFQINHMFKLFCRFLVSFLSVRAKMCCCKANRPDQLLLNVAVNWWLTCLLRFWFITSQKRKSLWEFLETLDQLDRKDVYQWM